MFDLVEVKHCQHNDIRDCPLYAASHEAMGGCVYGEWAVGCAVARGDASYPELVASLKWRHRNWFAEWSASIAKRQYDEQRDN